MLRHLANRALAAVGVGVALTARAADPATAFEARFEPLYAAVFAKGGTFSGSAMSADLQALEPLARQQGVAARDTFRLYYAEAIVFGLRKMSEEAEAAARKALTAMPQADSVELAYPHFLLRYSSIRWLADAKQYDAALKLIRSFQAQYPLDRIADLPAQIRQDGEPRRDGTRVFDFPTQLQILGVYEDEGYVLHEQGKYREAKQANARMLPVARKLTKALGAPEKLRGVLNNIAQNCYELGEFDEDHAYLQERLQIALATHDHATVYDSYFQLMVLAHEQKQSDKAHQWLAMYVQYAQTQKDSEQLARAKELQAELDHRESGRHSDYPPEPAAQVR